LERERGDLVERRRRDFRISKPRERSNMKL